MRFALFKHKANSGEYTLEFAFFLRFIDATDTLVQLIRLRMTCQLQGWMAIRERGLKGPMN